MLNEHFRPLPKGCVSELTFDRKRARELTSTALSAVEAHLAECASCRERERQLSQEAATFLSHFPRLEPVAGRSKVVSLGKRRFVVATSFGASILAAAAGLVLGWPVGESREPLEATTRIKGGERFAFRVRRGTQVLPGIDEPVLYPGDQLRFSVSTSSALELVVLSRDGAGKVSDYYPGTGHSAKAPMGATVALETSVELDGTLGAEQLWAVFCDEPFTVAPLAAELTARGRLTAPAPGCTIETRTFVKRAVP